MSTAEDPQPDATSSLHRFKHHHTRPAPTRPATRRQACCNTRPAAASARVDHAARSLHRARCNSQPRPCSHGQQRVLRAAMRPATHGSHHRVPRDSLPRTRGRADVCNNDDASVFCTADEAALPLQPATRDQRTVEQPRFVLRDADVSRDHHAASTELAATRSRDHAATLEGFAYDVLAILEELHVESCIFVGHSVSSMIGAIAAITRHDQQLALDFSRLIAPALGGELSSNSVMASQLSSPPTASLK